jgi:hypothetical protein
MADEEDSKRGDRWGSSVPFNTRSQHTAPAADAPAAPHPNPAPNAHGHTPTRQHPRTPRTSQPTLHQPPLDRGRVTAYRDQRRLQASPHGPPVESGKGRREAVAHHERAHTAAETNKDNHPVAALNPSSPSTPPAYPHVLILSAAEQLLDVVARQTMVLSVRPAHCLRRPVVAVDDALSPHVSAG